jgi:hypothetical protein
MSEGRSEGEDTAAIQTKDGLDVFYRDFGAHRPVALSRWQMPSFLGHGSRGIVRFENTWKTPKTASTKNNR